MADRGFTIGKELEAIGVKLIIPAFVVLIALSFMEVR